MRRMGKRHREDETEVVLPEPADAGIDQQFAQFSKRFHEGMLPGCALRTRRGVFACCRAGCPLCTRRYACTYGH